MTNKMATNIDQANELMYNDRKITGITIIREIVNKFGKLYTLYPLIILKTYGICLYHRLKILVMKVIINFFSCFFADSVNFHQIGQAGLCNFIGRAEMVKQIAFAFGADSPDFIQARF